MAKQKKQDSQKQDSQAGLVKFGDNLSPNLITVPKFETVAELKADYDLHDVAAKKNFGSMMDAGEEFLKELSYMQALLSKHGVNHGLIVEARKQAKEKHTDTDIPWFTEYLEMHGVLADQSLRTVQRKIAAYRAGETGVLTCKTKGCDRPQADGCGGHCKAHKPAKPMHLNQSGLKTMIAAAVAGRELADAVEAGRDGKDEVKAFRKVQHSDRLNDVLAAAETTPDYQKAYEDTRRGFRLVLDAFEKQDVNRTLPADLRKVVRDARKEFFPENSVKAKPKKSTVTVLEAEKPAATKPKKSIATVLEEEKPTLAAPIKVVPLFSMKKEAKTIDGVRYEQYRIAKFGDDSYVGDVFDEQGTAQAFADSLNNQPHMQPFEPASKKAGA